MRIIFPVLLLMSAQSLWAAGIPVYVDQATTSEVQTGTNVSGRMVAGVIHTLSAEGRNGFDHERPRWRLGEGE